MSSVAKYNHVIVEKDRGLTWVTLEFAPISAMR